jgi:predicted dehydrogenase
MGKPVAVGFIGCGKHARKAHGAIIASYPNLFSVKAVYDPSFESVDNFVRIFPDSLIFLARSVEELFYSGIKAVFISTPHEFHLEYAEQAIRAGKHIFCEKPLCADEKEIFRLANLLDFARSKNLIFTSCHPRRFDPVFEAVREVLPRWVQDFGAVREVLFRFFYHVPPNGWRKQDSLLLDHMNHEIDLVNFLLGFQRVSLRKIRDGFDSYAVSGIRDDGVGIYFSGERRLLTRTYRNELEIRFERGRIFAHSVLRKGIVRPSIIVENFENDDKNDDENDEKVITTFAPHSYDEAFVKIMRNFHAAIRGEELNYLESCSLLENTGACVSLLKRDWYWTP